MNLYSVDYFRYSNKIISEKEAAEYANFKHPTHVTAPSFLEAVDKIRKIAIPSWLELAEVKLVRNNIKITE